MAGSLNLKKTANLLQLLSPEPPRSPVATLLSSNLSKPHLLLVLKMNIHTLQTTLSLFTSRFQQCTRPSAMRQGLRRHKAPGTYLGQVVGDAGGHVQQAIGHVAQALLDQPRGDLLEDSVAVLQNLPTQEGAPKKLDGRRMEQGRAVGRDKAASRRPTALQADPRSDFLGQHS